MIIGFHGKGGIGKSTLTAGYALWLAQQGGLVAAVDADVNQQLGIKLGFTEDQIRQIPALSGFWRDLRAYYVATTKRWKTAVTFLKPRRPQQAHDCSGFSKTNL